MNARQARKITKRGYPTNGRIVRSWWDARRRDARRRGFFRGMPGFRIGLYLTAILPDDSLARLRAEARVEREKEKHPA